MTPTRSVPRLSFSPERLESQSLIVTYDFRFPSSAFASRVVGKSTIFTNIGKCASKIKAVETKLTTTTRSNCSLAFCLLRERKTQLWRDLNGTKKKSISSRYFVQPCPIFIKYQNAEWLRLALFAVIFSCLHHKWNTIHCYCAAISRSCPAARLNFIVLHVKGYWNIPCSFFRFGRKLNAEIKQNKR